MYLTDVSNPAIPPSIGNTGSGSFQGAGPAASDLISALIQLGFVVGGLAFILMFLLGGYQWITSGGDKDGLSKAKNRIVHALTGLIVLFSLYAIISFLGGFLGIDLSNFTLPSIV